MDRSVPTSPHVAPPPIPGSAPPQPPSYASSSRAAPPLLTYSPSNVAVISSGDGPRVPHAVSLTNVTPQPVSNKGTLNIHIPAWGLVLVWPPYVPDIPSSDFSSSEREPPAEDTVLSGALEVIMKERRRVKSISVCVQGVSRLYMGKERGWEEDGIFERGVEVLGGDEEGIWLEKGRQSFGFAILLPATLAATDTHTFGRVSYILTARVEGIPTSSRTFNSYFSSTPRSGLDPAIPNIVDFERVIARSDRKGKGRSDSASSGLSHQRGGAEQAGPGLYTLRQPTSPPLSPGPIGGSESASSSTSSLASRLEGLSPSDGWLKGDLCASRELQVHGNPDGVVTRANEIKEGDVEGLGHWCTRATSDIICLSAAVLWHVSIPSPSPSTTIFLVRVVLSQRYTVTSPRNPTAPPTKPEATKRIVIYQVGRAHKQGEEFPARDVPSLWRGPEAGGDGDPAKGWEIKKLVRMPDHDTISATTSRGTITPLRVKHEVVMQIFYSIDGKSAIGKDIDGPGELRVMTMTMPAFLPSCRCTKASLTLPSYESAHSAPADNIDAIITSPPTKDRCLCGSTFAELGEATLKRWQRMEEEDAVVRARQEREEQEAAARSGKSEPSEQARVEGGDV
ncbi:hypothetical protein IAT38_004035 [Cryptococcus sp. DSM 104549]